MTVLFCGNKLEFIGVSLAQHTDKMKYTACISSCWGTSVPTNEVTTRASLRSTLLLSLGRAKLALRIKVCDA